MRLLDLTLATPEENLALDEALLNAAEDDPTLGVVLRLWESPTHAVVLGRNSQRQVEVDVGACESRGIPILRRTSGGASVLMGPGCLMYSLVLSCTQRPHLRAVDQAHQFVLGQIAAAIAPLAPGIARRGTSDLAVGDLKVSGNSSRYCRDNLLYHGTLLYDFDLPLIGNCLKSPPRQPKYRRGRRHGEFVMNLPVPANELRQRLRSAWTADEAMTAWPEEATSRLVAERYLRREWTESR